MPLAERRYRTVTARGHAAAPHSRAHAAAVSIDDHRPETVYGLPGGMKP